MKLHHTPASHASSEFLLCIHNLDHARHKQHAFQHIYTDLPHSQVHLAGGNDCLSGGSRKWHAPCSRHCPNFYVLAGCISANSVHKASACRGCNFHPILTNMQFDKDSPSTTQEKVLPIIHILAIHCNKPQCLLKRSEIQQCAKGK